MGVEAAPTGTDATTPTPITTAAHPAQRDIALPRMMAAPAAMSVRPNKIPVISNHAWLIETMV